MRPNGVDVPPDVPVELDELPVELDVLPVELPAELPVELPVEPVAPVLVDPAPELVDPADTGDEQHGSNNRSSSMMGGTALPSIDSAGMLDRSHGG